MAVSTHLKIELSDYDQRIRTFIPYYEEMLDTAAAALRAATQQPRVLLDLGIGSGALAARCVAVLPEVAIAGIDADHGMLAMAASRLGPGRASLVHGDFARVPLPACELMTASFALHHIPTRRRKTAFYARAFSALAPGGLLINADCCLAANPALVARDRAFWRAHLEQFYSADEAEAYLQAWAQEDVYFRLEEELSMLCAAGFTNDVVWRRASFAVIVAAKPARRPAKNRAFQQPLR